MGKAGGEGAFDVSVLCTAYMDLNVLLNPGRHELGAKLMGPLLWNVNVRSELYGRKRGCLLGNSSGRGCRRFLLD